MFGFDQVTTTCTDCHREFRKGSADPVIKMYDGESVIGDDMDELNRTVLIVVFVISYTKANQSFSSQFTSSLF